MKLYTQASIWVGKLNASFRRHGFAPADSALRCVAVWCSVLQRGAVVCGGVCVAVCCRACVCVVFMDLLLPTVLSVVLQCVAVCCNVLQCVLHCVLRSAVR